MTDTHDDKHPEFEVQKGTIIYEQGSSCSSMFLLKSGTVGLYLNYHTPQQFQLFEISKPNSSLGEMGLFEQEPRNATAVALSDCQLVEISQENFPTFIASHPEATKQIILDLSQRFKMAIQEVRNSQQIILESLEALKEAQANKKDSLKERIRKISDYLLDIPEDVPPELYLSFNSRFHGTMF
ncbi:Crp/Fnr family transcriptional regulator [Sphaerochaeta halotolerans]|jgi:CRP-like cAMP-binding protein|uniref:Crp/Fnr family transcriptional regulator n=1 Tax=Sphaerochaeta halotolerans TaxID=2293840 RepID=A0A372MKB0_9SPIR|nr:cyclic nucleotide-binding domain-containing protein [Sphaerochaeta halotolerans]MBG0767732.1 cyclic nucleotide-binding domain-containing protein [Spirochaetaceae bacterium]MDN5334818.1 family transcriptional regulator, cyclic receptor protein [Sphaerochaeta sp.]MXI86019.1 cyclic nucleotide-binding domain-containing protein [Sphaerochaeta halotolerans]RFU95620.1 Crp/Fnr family transcriptional regulator [Sphaerochaeta halotolerans]